VDDDPYASLGDAYKTGLTQWCTTKKASAVFEWYVEDEDPDLGAY
jgi:hypothetical protein